MPSDPSLGQALSDIEQAMPGFARWLYHTVRRDLGERVLDAGAGIGTYTDLMLRDRKTVTSIEFVPSFVEELHRRFRDDSRVALRQGDLADPTALAGLTPFDSALCLNVFEHIEDDLQAMRNLHDAVRPGGSLVALVPAYHWLFNKMDTAVGHFRRYGRTEYLHRLTEAGWHVERHFRFN